MPHEEIILTASRKKELEEELKDLRIVKRPEITEQIKRAREYGDLSENFEYQAAKQAQAILNGRMAELEAVLDRARVIEDGSENNDSVSIGSVVLVKILSDEEDEEDELTIVDAMSANPADNKISYSSPVGQALIKKKVGDEVKVTTPGGIIIYQVLNIR